MRNATVAELDSLANHPLIYPSTGHPKGGYISTAPLLDDPHNIALIDKPGAMFFEFVRPGVYDCHFLFLPCCGGKAILQSARAMLKEMFTNRGACVITGKPPRGNRAVRTIGTALGFTRNHGQDFTDALGRDCIVYTLKENQCR